MVQFVIQINVQGSFYLIFNFCKFWIHQPKFLNKLCLYHYQQHLNLAWMVMIESDENRKQRMVLLPGLVKDSLRFEAFQVFK